MSMSDTRTVSERRSLVDGELELVICYKNGVINGGFIKKKGVGNSTNMLHGLTLDDLDKIKQLLEVVI